MHNGLRPRPSGCGSSPLCIHAGSLLITAINRIKITFDYDKCTLCHIIIIGVIFTGMCEVSWGYQSWLKVTIFPLCARELLVQAPSGKTRFPPPSALKGTCAKAKMEAGWFVASLPRPRVVVGSYSRALWDCFTFGSQSQRTRSSRAPSPLASVASSLRSSAPPCFHLRFSALCACRVSVQAPSAKTRFAPPSALKGTCV